MMTVRYFVYRNHTLVYQGLPGVTFGVLKGDIWAGGDPDPMRGTMCCDPDDLAVATLKDFARFRVAAPKGYADPDAATAAEWLRLAKDGYWAALADSAEAEMQRVAKIAAL